MSASFELRYKGQEDHLMMPPLTKLMVAQSLYDILFQYLLTPEMEQKLQAFTKKIEAYLDTKTYRQTPFSIPVQELAFLDEGLEELKMLCWVPLPVHIFEVTIPGAGADEAGQAARDEAERILADLFVFNWRGDSEIIVYPSELM
ncbi:MAG: hypothetical protein ACM3QZ_05330 [Solirubrobacterales bacterium]